MNTLAPEGPNEPPRELRGDLAAQSRYAELVGVLGDPEERSERSVLLLLARLLSQDETRRLLVLIRRAMRAAQD
jgi:hypothetical protein